MKKLLGILSLLSLAVTGWSGPFPPPLIRQFFTTNEVAGGIMSNTIAVHGPIGGDRVYTGSTGLTNAFWNATNYDTIDIGPGTYTFAAYKRGAVPFAYGALQIGRTTATDGYHDITIRGHSAVLQTTNYGTVLGLVGASNVTISGLTFIGDHSSLTNYTNANWKIECAIATSTNTTGFTVENIVIDNCKFIDIPNQGISFLAGGGRNCHVRNCYFNHLGATKAFPGGTAPDGSCISGIMWGGSVMNNVATNVTSFYEWDGGQAGYDKIISDGLVIKNNAVDRVYDFGFIFIPGNSGCSLQNLTLADNTIRFRSGFEAYNGVDIYSAGIFLDGSVSNSTIRGNHIYGVTNTLGYQMWLQDTKGKFIDLTVTENTFADSTRFGIAFDCVAGNVAEGITFSKNQFRDVTYPMYVMGPNVVLEGNSYRSWPASQGAIYIQKGSGVNCVSNIVVRGEVFHPSNNNVNCVVVTGDSYPNLSILDMDIRYPYSITPVGVSIATAASNILYRGSGSGAPSVGFKVGSIYSRTDTSTAGSVYVQTNSMGLDGWVAVGAAGSASGAYIPYLNGSGTNLDLYTANPVNTPLLIHRDASQVGPLLSVLTADAAIMVTVDASGNLNITNTVNTTNLNAQTANITTQNMSQATATSMTVTSVYFTAGILLTNGGVTNGYGKWFVGNGGGLTNNNGGVYLNAVTDTNAWGYDGIVDMDKTCQITNLGGAITISGPTNGPAAGKVKAVRFYIIGDSSTRLVTVPASWKNKNAAANLFYVTNGWTAVCTLEVVGGTMTNFGYVLDQ